MESGRSSAEGGSFVTIVHCVTAVTGGRKVEAESVAGLTDDAGGPRGN